MDKTRKRASEEQALALGLMKSQLWDAGAAPDLTAMTLINRLSQEVRCVAPADTVALYWRFFAPRQRLNFAVNLAARVLINFPKGRTNFPEPLDLLHAMAFRYLGTDGICRLYQWDHWQKDNKALASPRKKGSAPGTASSDSGPTNASLEQVVGIHDGGRLWLKYVFFRLVGKDRMGPLASLASKPGWTPPTEPIHRSGDGGDGSDGSGAAEDLEFSDDSDGLDEAFATAMPQALHLTRLAVAECAAAGGFGANGGKAEQVFISLYVEAQTPAEVVRKTGAKRDFVKQMENVAWLDSTLRQHCQQATIDAITNAILFHARK